ncbi:MAG TPA: ATP-binding domain-containing protein [Acidimicrobiales bacterium]
MANHPDLQAEQAYVDRAYDRLEAMRRAAEALRDSVIDAGRGGTHQARVERDVFVQTSLQRLEQLQLGRAALCFGRIDRVRPEAADGTEPHGANGSGPSPANGSGPSPATGSDASPAVDGGPLERFYIGRLAVSDEHQEPVIVDWRAPVAEAFYRATGRAPMGLRRRRHFATEGRSVLGIEDELFGVAGDDADGGGELVGPGALLTALERSRSGQMRDIVATVQREQDEIIRADLPGVLVVQGGPGTGKTAVALHRAAYLLYTYRFPLEQQGVLVVGPNQVFLRYIEQVLPSLGESGVVLTTVAGLLGNARIRGMDSPIAARVKGDARMAGVLARAVEGRQRGLGRDLTVGFGALSLRVTAATTRAIVATVKRRPGTHNARRGQVEAMLLRALYEQYAAAVARGRRTGLVTGLTGPDGVELDAAQLSAQVRRDPVVVTALDRMWPLLAPEDLLNDLFGSPALLALATDRVLGPDERDALGRDRAHALEELAWTAGDIPLLDEARALLGPLRGRRRSGANGRAPDPDGEARGYGHIVVDEAQDVSPMALRMLARRSVTGSMTIVGDIGQATTGTAPSTWDDVLAHLPSRRPARIVNLTVNYRTPAEIMDVAAEVLAGVGSVGWEPPRSVRTTGHPAEVRAVGDAAELDAEVARAASDELSAVGGGTVAVIAPSARLAGLGAALATADLPWGDPARTGLSAPITLLDVPAAKGLEFDSVVVVEPAGIAGEGPEGMRALFVALTRPTRRLVIVHQAPLPASLARGLARARDAIYDDTPLAAVDDSDDGPYPTAQGSFF